MATAKELYTIRNLIDIQLNCLCDPYMYGLANGLIVSYNCLTPASQLNYVDTRDLKKCKVRHKCSKP